MLQHRSDAKTKLPTYWRFAHEIITYIPTLKNYHLST